MLDPGELCSLRPIDMDCSDEVWEYRPESHKLEHHGKSRVVCFGNKAQEICGSTSKGRLLFLRRTAPSPADAEQQRLAARHAERKTPLNQGNRPGSIKSNRRSGDRATATPSTATAERLPGRASEPKFRMGSESPATHKSH